MNQFSKLTPAKLKAFNLSANQMNQELEAIIFAMKMAFEYDALELEAFKELKNLNDFILKETFKEYNRQTKNNQ
jgi:hypothetical protein